MTTFRTSFLRDVNFNYLIYANQVFWPEEPILVRRNLYVLMDEGAFTEANLREVFGVLSDAFPEPATLSVSVKTSLEQIRPLGPARSDAEPDPPNADKHNWSTYNRMGANEFFRYSVNPPDQNSKTVVLKGVDPVGRNQPQARRRLPLR